MSQLVSLVLSKDGAIGSLNIRHIDYSPLGKVMKVQRPFKWYDPHESVFSIMTSRLHPACTRRTGWQGPFLSL